MWSVIRKEVEVNGLTKRELEVLRLIAHGLKNKMIAEELGTVHHTVKCQVSSILIKLEAKNRAHAVFLAIERGLL